MVFDCLLLVQRCLLFVLPVLSVSALKLRGLRIVVSRGTVRYVTVEYFSSVILLLYKGAAGLLPVAPVFVSKHVQLFPVDCQC